MYTHVYIYMCILSGIGIGYAYMHTVHGTKMGPPAHLTYAPYVYIPTKYKRKRMKHITVAKHGAGNGYAHAHTHLQIIVCKAMGICLA